MTTKLQQEIEAANRRTQKSRNRQFAKRASDEQMLERLVESAKIVVNEYESGGQSLEAAIRALRTATILAERRAR